MKKFAIAAVAAMALSFVAQAAVLNCTVTVVQAAGTFKVYAQVDANSAGLASIALTPKLTGSIQITSSQMDTPQLYNAAFASIGGFNQHVSDTALTAGQSTIYSGGNDVHSDSTVVQGVGSVAIPMGTVQQVWTSAYNPISHTTVWSQTPGTIWADYGVPALIAEGTYTGTGTVSFDVNGNLLKKVNGGAWAGPGNIAGKDSPTGDTVAWTVVPEPATMSLLGLGALALIRRRK